MSEPVSVSVESSTAVSSESPAIAVSLWFDMQPNADAGTLVPHWARTLAQAYVDHRLWVLAHPDSAYARSGLVCELVKCATWPDVAWQALLSHQLAQARAHGARQVVIMLPYRTSPALWVQWALDTLPQLGGYLDNTTGLLQGLDGWEHTLYRADAVRWLMIDRVLTYGAGRAPSEYVSQMRAFNPMAHWIHDHLLTQEVLEQTLEAYHPSAPLAQVALKNDDLSAWNANKVVYFSSYSRVDRAKIEALIQRWRQRYGGQIVRMWATLWVDQMREPLAVSGVHHVWRMNFMPNHSADDMAQSGVWLLGQSLDVATLRTELELCSA